MDIANIRRHNLQQYIDAFAKGSIAELSRMSGKSSSQINDNLKGRKPFGERFARAMEKGLDLEEGSLDQPHLDTKHSETNNHSTDVDDKFTIPQYDTGGKMGDGLVLRDQPGVIDSWRVSEEWIRLNTKRITSPKNLAIVTGFGDSMRPMYNPGDPLLVDTGHTELDHDGVYFFRVGDEGFIKRLQRVPGKGIKVLSENKSYDSWYITDDMDFEVFAKIVKAWCGEDF